MDLARRGRAARLDQLAAGGDDHDAGPRAGPGPGRGRRRRAARSGPARAGCRRRGPARRRDVLAARGGCTAPGFGAWVMRDRGDAAVGPLDRDDGVGAGRHRRAGHDPHAEPGLHACRPTATRPRCRRRPAAAPGRSPTRPRRRRRARRSRPSRSCRRAAGRRRRRRPRPGCSRARRAAGGRAARAARCPTRMSARCWSTDFILLGLPASHASSVDELAQPRPEVRPEVVTLAGEPHHRLEVVQPVAGVVAAAGEHDAVHRPVLGRPRPACAARR